MLRWSIGLGILGVALSALGVRRYRRISPGEESDRCWLIGLFGLFPGWLVAIWGLLGAGNFDSPSYSPPRSLIFSSAAALIGIIVSDFARRRLGGFALAMPPALYWLLGLAAFAPAWVVALWSLR